MKETIYVVMKNEGRGGGWVPFKAFADWEHQTDLDADAAWFMKDHREQYPQYDLTLKKISFQGDP